MELTRYNLNWTARKALSDMFWNSRAWIEKDKLGPFVLYDNAARVITLLTDALKNKTIHVHPPDCVCVTCEDARNILNDCSRIVRETVEKQTKLQDDYDKLSEQVERLLAENERLANYTIVWRNLAMKAEEHAEQVTEWLAELRTEIKTATNRVNNG